MQKGFTLLELLVVLVIIGMAASFSGPRLWKLYAKAQERAVIQNFASSLQSLRMDILHSGRSLEIAAVSESAINENTQLPALPDGWVLQKSTSLRLLSTGATNGGSFEFRSPSEKQWKLTLKPFDGHIEIHRL